MGDEPVPNPVAVAQAKIYEEKELLCVLVTRPQLVAIMGVLPDGVIHTSASTNLKTLQTKKRADFLLRVIVNNLSKAAKARIEELVG